MQSLREKVKNLLKDGQSLSQKVVRAGMWVFGIRVISRVFGLVRTIILARLLNPSDFGLFAIALLTVSALETFSQTGFETALVQKKEDIGQYLDTAWTALVLRGIILFGLLFFLAPLVARFFENSEITLVLQVIAISLLIRGFTNIGIVYFQKELELNKQFIYEFTGRVVDVFVAISLAFLWRNVWAFVFGLLGGEGVRLIASFVLHPHRPKLYFDLGKGRKMFSFGRWILGTNIVTFFANQGDDIFLGKMLGVTLLGFYQMAFQISEKIKSEITTVIGQVVFPAYSKLQDNTNKLREAYIRTLQFVNSITIPLASGLVILAPEFTKIVLTEKWLPIVPALRVLALAGVVRSIIAVGGNLFTAVGRPDIDFKMNAARVSVMAVAIYPLTALWGMVGTAMAVLLGLLVIFPVWVLASHRFVGLNLKEHIEVFFPPLAGAGLILATVLSFKLVVGRIYVTEFILAILASVLIYSAFVYALGKKYNYGVAKVIRTIIEST